MALKYLVTGATGGIGGGVTDYFKTHLPRSDFAASSSKITAKDHFSAQDIAFRHADYGDMQSLERAFSGVENLLFVSSNTFDNELRGRQHRNVVDAAKRVGVGHVWYTSLAFGGFRSDSKVNVQQAHLVTEEYMEESGINYTSIREGFYAEAFPLFLNWFPDTQTVHLPSDGAMAFTSRDELAEATAAIMLKGGYDRQIVLLTGPRAYTLSEMVSFVNEFSGRDVKVENVEQGDWVRLAVEHDRGGKGSGFFEKRLSWFEGVSEHGDGETVDPLMEELLGRVPKDGRQVVKELLTENRDYTWHQNYAK